MFNSIRAFYRSDEWANLRQQIMFDRLNNKGQTICEHCGQPIVKKYDMIFHHKIEITPINLNDINISLNPDNIMIVHHNCHNEIHQRFGFNQKKVYFVYGSPCSGKSSWVRNAAGRNDIILDMDSIWEAVSNNSKYNKPNSIKNVVLAIRETILEQIVMRNFEGNAYVLSTEGREMPRERLIQRINADEVIYVECSKGEALERLYNDNERQPYIKEHEEFINKFFNQINAS